MDRYVSNVKGWFKANSQPPAVPKPEPWESGPIDRFLIPWRVYWGETFVDPLLFGFALFVMFGHIQRLIDTSDSFEAFDNALRVDSMKSWPLYLGFLVVVIAWLWFKAQAIRWRDKKEKEFQRYLAKRLDNTDQTSEPHKTASEHFDSIL